MIIIKRPKKFLLIFLIPMFFLGCTLFNIIVLKGNLYTKMAVSQRIQTTEKPRNLIVDRNMIPFTKDNLRYDQVSIGEHVIGYTDSSGNGVIGIEKSFDKLLTDGADTKSLKYPSGKAIPNFKPIESKNSKSKYLKLTLDYHIQKIAENVLDEFNIDGAVVIMDVKSFDILSLVSRPKFDRSNVAIYAKYGDTELINRAISPYNAGSIFKIVTASAVLEADAEAENKSYFCDGYDVYDKISFTCHNRQGHGKLSLKDAFPLSCNCAFYEMGISLGSHIICEYGKLFGLDKTVLNAFFSESKGNIPSELSGSFSEVANLAIGQGEILITPLQAAKMVSIIASGGISKDVNIADCITDFEGNEIRSLKSHTSERVISQKTAEKVGEMMLASVNDGTGSNAKSDIVSIAGKTGSAETGWQTETG